MNEVNKVADIGALTFNRKQKINKYTKKKNKRTSR